MQNKIQIKRKSIPFFAPWANIDSNTVIKHSLDNGNIIYNAVKGESYANHIEMAGFLSATIISYGNNENNELMLMRHVIFPTLRLYPNDTHSSLDNNFNGITINIDGEVKSEIVDKLVFDGCINIFSHIDNVKIKRVLFAARNKPALCEILEFNSDDETSIEIINNDIENLTDTNIGADFRVYKLGCKIEHQNFMLKKGETFKTAVYYYGCNENDNVACDVNCEYDLRSHFIKDISEKLIIETPNENINEMIRYAKIRASESIFETKCGLMHSPGGGGYYAAVWTNDQCEYINPLFGYLGYDTGLKQAENSYDLYKKYISSDKALITSIIAEGDDIWHGAKDRGDSAMYAYGASRFLLSVGDKELAKNYIEYIRQCIDYTLSQVDIKYGIIKSDSDELENRFKSGNANLSTSCIAYDALISSSYLEKELGDEKRAHDYLIEAAALKNNIEKYFGRNVQGFDTYRYCKEEKKLRSWICIPLSVSIFDRADDTAKALMSDNLRVHEGLVTRSGEKTFWDRSTLYALRGLFLANKSEEVIELLEIYSNSRLLGNHIPYAVEAYPEGNQAQLSAESGLYIRIFTEGVLGYRPTGFNKFTLKPSLPKKWNTFKVSNFTCHGVNIDIDIARIDTGYKIEISKGIEKTVNYGDSLEILL